MAVERVAVGYIHPGDVAGRFCSSLATMILRDARCQRISHVIGVESSPRIAEGRSQVVDAFLGTTAEWLLMIDADMEWGPEAFDLLCAHANPETVPIIGGLCFGGGRSWNGEKPNIFPTLYRFAKRDDTLVTETLEDYPRDQLIPIGATGAAFLMVHRSVFHKLKVVLAKDANGDPNPYPWFAEIVYKGQPVGEDVTFCMRAQAAGFPIHVHTGALVAHRKSIMLDQALHDQVRR